MKTADLTSATWRKSSFSSHDGTCVEVAALADGRVALRDSYRPNGGVLLSDRGAVAAFIQGVKSSQFDDPNG